MEESPATGEPEQMMCGNIRMTSFPKNLCGL